MDEEEADSQNQPDDEGWVTVGRSGRNPGAPRLDAAELQERRKKKKKVLTLFHCIDVSFALLTWHKYISREEIRTVRRGAIFLVLVGTDGIIFYLYLFFYLFIYLFILQQALLNFYQFQQRETRRERE